MKPRCPCNVNLNQEQLDEYTKNLPVNLDNNTVSIFWTGGFDSTFRVCQLLFDEKKKVQPIYLLCDDVDSPSTNMIDHRKNTDKELESMEKIKNYLLTKYPDIGRRLNKLLIVNKIPINFEYDKMAQIVHNKLGYFARTYTQYERMARFSKYYPGKYIEVGVDKCGTGLDRATKKYRIGKGGSCRIRDNLYGNDRCMLIFKKFRMPIVHLDKKEMYNIALKGSYEDILGMTWSCWMPINGNPCGRCEMCQKRLKIVK